MSNNTGSLYGITPGTMSSNKAVILNKDGLANWVIKTASDSTPVKLNSRNYTRTSGDSSGVQVKPNQSVTGTAGITGMEVSPRFAAGIGGNSLVGIKCDPLLKAGSGNLSGAVTGVQCNIDFGVSGTRTITGDVSAFESFLAIPSSNTYSGDISFLRIRTVNIKAWDFFLNCDDANVGAVTVSANGMFKDPEGDQEAGFLKIRIATVAYEVPFYASS